MITARRPRPRTALLQLTFALVGAGWLAGCQSPAREAPSPAPLAVAAAWQVVERLGDARWRGAEGGIWTPALPAAQLPAGSDVTTGHGGRLIAARAGMHISVGPGSRFSLPDAASQPALEQHAGRLRYRIAQVAPQPLVVTTRFLEIAPQVAVFDVTVTPAATEVAVERGSVRIATPDGTRQIELGAGQSAYAGAGTGQSEALTFRRAPGQPAEPVAPIILPAMKPRATSAEGRAVAAPIAVTFTGGRASSSGADASEAAAIVEAAGVSAAAASRRATAIAAIPALAPAVEHEKPAIDFSDGVVLQAGVIEKDDPDAENAPPAARGAPADVPEPVPAVPDASASGSATPAPGGPAAAAPASEAAGAPPLADDRASVFDRLTSGMVGVAAPPQAADPPAGRTPSF